MRRIPAPLLCELHAHTTWSDGSLTPRELVDLCGRAKEPGAVVEFLRSPRPAALVALGESGVTPQLRAA